MERPTIDRRWLWWLGALVAAAALLLWAGERWADGMARRTASADARQLAGSNAALFNSELQKFRLLPVVLADYPDVAALLHSGGAVAGQVNARLERLARETDAAAIYVVRSDGQTLAASNFRAPTSFVGKNYAFRPYVRDALARGDAELFALGTVSGRPGLYLARRIGDAERPLGVIVVKVEFDRLQREWARQNGITLVSDNHDIVIVAGRRDWQFRTLRQLDRAERADIAASRQFDGAMLEQLPFNARSPDILLANSRYRAVTIPVGLAGGHLITLLPMQPAIAGAQAQARVVVVLTLFALIALLAWQYRQSERVAQQETVRRQLESKVAERTAELEAANRSLHRESRERAASEARYRRSREELAQANRLGTLGQVSAGVAHEINQPVAAIRTFAENASAFLAKAKAEKVGENLRHIIGLTERIATITGELRSFARRKTPDIGPTSLTEAIDAALLLTRHRITAAKVAVDWNKRAAAITVRADRVRLEQIFVNLIQNSLDALEGRDDGRIAFAVALDDALVKVTVRDNGAGMATSLQPKLFTPFVTGKDQGLGLGLAIVRDIIREFGGEVVLLSSSASGTCFELRLLKL